MWNQDRFCHILQIIVGIEVILGDDYFTKGVPVGWNLKGIGKNDTTMIGIVVALGQMIN